MFDEFPHPSLCNSASTKNLNSIARCVLTTSRGVTFQESNLSAKLYAQSVNADEIHVDKWLPSEFSGLLFVRLRTLGYWSGHIVLFSTYEKTLTILHI